MNSTWRGQSHWNHCKKYIYIQIKIKNHCAPQTHKPYYSTILCWIILIVKKKAFIISRIWWKVKICFTLDEIYMNVCMVLCASFRLLETFQMKCLSVINTRASGMCHLSGTRCKGQNIWEGTYWRRRKGSRFYPNTDETPWMRSA